ncbi:Alpha/Beta hydrolase protein, partial [Chytriomyces sp. MP71]
VILYLHGGGYALCSRKTHRGLTSKVAKHSGARVFAIDYRLAPEHVFPCALHDSISAYAYILATAQTDPRKVFIGGDSAGAGLALATALWLRDEGAKHGLPMPCGVGLMSPWLDLSHSLPSFESMGRYDLLRAKVIDETVISEERSHFYIRDNTFLRNPLVSPLFASATDTPLPPLLIQVGSVERLRDESLVFCLDRFPAPARVRLEVYEGMVHVFQMLARLIRVSEVAFERFGTFAR